MRLNARALVAAAVLGGTLLALVMATQASAVVYWANWGNASFGSSIGRANLDGTLPQNTFVSPTGPRPCGVAVDDEYVYYAHLGTGGLGTAGIGRVRRDGSDVQNDFITTGGGPCGVAVNDTHVFWANGNNFGGGSTIGRANVDGSSPNASFITNAGSTVCGVAVNATHVYWASLGGGTIGRANLNGSAANSSFISGLGGPCGVALDSSYVYWSDLPFEAGAIGRANLDGGSVDTDFIPTSELDSTRPCGIAVDDGHIYWGDWTFDSDRIGRAELDGANVNQSFIANTAAEVCGVAVDAAPIYPPACEDIELQTEVGTGIPVQLDCAGPGSLTYEIVTNPSLGTLGTLDAATGEVPYTAPDAPGTDTFSYRATNAGGGSSPATVTIEVHPSSEFTFAGVKRNRRRGIAKLAIRVPGAGKYRLTGKGLKRVNRVARGARTAQLLVRTKGARKRKLNRRGSVRVVARVRFSPTGGLPKTKARRIKLVKRR